MEKLEVKPITMENLYNSRAKQVDVIKSNIMALSQATDNILKIDNLIINLTNQKQDKSKDNKGKTK